MDICNINATGWDLKNPPELISAGVGVHAPGQLKTICHEDFWALHLYRYDAILNIEGEDYPIHPGYLSLIPPQVTFRNMVQKEKSVHVFCFLRLKKDAKSQIKIPYLQDFSRNFSQANRMLEEAVQLFPVDKTRAALRVWDVLLCAVEKTLEKAEKSPSDWLVDNFVQWVEGNLDRELDIKNITDSFNCSYTHLNNQVKKKLGFSVKQYIRKQRLVRMISLMKYTDYSVKEIAISSGFSSLQAFNQFIQRECNVSPRELCENVKREFKQNK